MMEKRKRRRSALGLSALALAGLACTCGLGGIGGLLGLSEGAADLGDYVWLDIDGDGIQEQAEEGVAGVSVRLMQADGQVVAETITDGDGHYGFEAVESGEYVLQFVPPPDLRFTLPDAGPDDAVDSDASQSDGRTAPFEVSGPDDSRDAGLIPQPAASPTPQPTATVAATPTTEPAAVPEAEITFEHTMPGQYSEIVVRVSGLASGQSVSGQVATANMSAIEGDGSFTLTAENDGTAVARITIYQFGEYVVTIPDLAVAETLTVE